MLTTIATTASSVGRRLLERSLPAPLSAAVRARVSAPTLVLLYHRVAPDPGPDVNRLNVTPERFDAQLAWLTRHARVERAAAFAARLGRRTLSTRPRVLITFDDGYVDNLRHALPILRARGLSATLFVTVGAVGRRAFWWDRLERIVRALHGPDGVRHGADMRLPGGRRVPRAARSEATYAALHTILKRQPPMPRAEALRSLSAQATAAHRTHGWPAARPPRPPAAANAPVRRARARARPMTWDELRAWRSAGMSVGCHALSHTQLAACDDRRLEAEVRLARARLERRLAARVRAFAYPFGGREDFDARAVRLVERAGFACAFAGWPGDARWAPSRFLIPRCIVRDWSADEFARRFATWCGR